MATNLDPQLLAQILAMRQQQAVGSGGGNVWYDSSLKTDDPMAYMLHQYLGQAPDIARGYSAESGVMARDPSQDQNFITKLLPDTGGKMGEQWDTQGNYLGNIELNSGGGRDMNQAIALIAGGILGGGYLNGGEAAGGLNGLDAAMVDMGAGATNVGAGGLGAGTAAGTAGGTAAGGAGTSAAGSAVKAGVDALGGGKGVAALLGAAAGAADSGDKSTSKTNDPWAPAQPYLQGLLSEGAQLYGQMKAEPFSQSQQAGYTNIGGLLDLVNKNAGGLLSGFQANASGANQFRRGQQQGLIGSSFNPTADQWQPQQFGDMGMTALRNRGR